MRNVITEFSKYFIKIIDMNKINRYSKHDYEATGLTTSNELRKIFIEEKLRIKYDIHQYSASTLIEKTKVDHFQKLQEENPGAIIYYIVMCQEGWIVFNITNRFKDNYKWNWTERFLPHSTYFKNRNYEEEITDMIACTFSYKDKIKLYD